jgi:dTDP-4-amino-4,6-dideoxygalactose transaminase
METMVELIPVANPLAQTESYIKEIQNAINEVILSGWYILGKSVELFEKEFAEYLNAKFCVGVASGTDALILALKAVGIHPGDEVITVSHTAVATVAAIELTGAVPVFADIDPFTRCLDPACLPSLISPRTRAVLPVHIYGQPAPMEEIISIAKQNDLKIIEDCAQAHGAEIKGQKVGTFGDAATFSFYPTKNLGALGDGGAVVSNSAQVAQNVRLLREYGWSNRYISSVPGSNSRLDEIQAAILRVKLAHLEDDNIRRRRIGKHYSQSIKGSDLRYPEQIPETLHAMHLFVVESNHRELFAAYMKKSGIGTAVHYPVAIHNQPAYRDRIRGCNQLQQTDDLYEKIVSLPMYPELTDHQVDRICTAIKNYESNGSH